MFCCAYAASLRAQSRGRYPSSGCTFDSVRLFVCGSCLVRPACINTAKMENQMANNMENVVIQGLYLWFHENTNITALALIIQ